MARKILLEAGVLALIGIVAISWAATDDHPTRAIAVLAAVFTLAAFVVSWIVVRTEWPQFEKWRETIEAKPLLHVWLEYAADLNATSK